MEQKPRGAMLSRRGFLKAAAATGAAGSAGASLTGIAASAAQAEPAASETLGFTYHNEHCLCNCMLQCTVRDGRLAMIQPRENEDKRFQNVCLKGISEVQNIYGDARIQRPMKRVGERGSGEFEAISWDEAFQMIAENFKAIQDKYGKEALWIQFSTEASQRFPPLLASVLGAQAGGLNGYDMGQGNGQIMAFSPWIGMFAQNTMWEWPEAMGLGDLFPADGEEYARALLTTDDPQMAGFTLEKLQEAGGALRLIGSEDLIAPEVGFTYGTASGRQEPYYEALLEFGQAFPAWEAPCEAYPENPLREKYPLQFNQARSRFRVHSAYSGAKWIQEVAEPHIELNPADAATRGLEDGDAVEVFNDRGSFRTVLRVNEAVRPESAFMVESTYRQYLDGTIMQSVSNDTLNPRGYALPFGPMIPYNDTLIEIKEVGE